MARGQLVGQRAAPPSALEKMVLAQKVPVTLGSLAVGETVTLNVDGAPREWIVVHRGKPNSIYSSTFTGGTILMMKDIYEERRWHSSNANDYANSTIHAYLNSTFLAKLDPAVQAAVKQVRIPYRPGSGVDKTITSGESGLAAKVWLASGYEVGFTASDNTSFPADGAKFSFFLSGGASDAQAKRLAYLSGSADDWWLRSPCCRSGSGSALAWVVDFDGSDSNDNCSNSYGIRPCIVLPDSYVLAVPATLTDLQGNPLSIQAEQISGGVRMVTGSYTGEKQMETGASAAKTLTAPVTPIAVFISRVDEGGGMQSLGWTAFMVKGGVGTSTATEGIARLKVTWANDRVTFYAETTPPGSTGANATALASMNSVGVPYAYCIIGQ